jgi:IS1 family transposase
MNRLSTLKRAAIVRALVEGNSVRSTARLTAADKETVMRLLADVGAACDVYQGGALRNLKCKRIECDEIWSFVGAKAKNVPESRESEYGIGDAYTWVALDPDSKLVVTWRIGQRSADDAQRFMNDLASRLSNRIQLTTDGYGPYVAAVFFAFGGKHTIDFAQLVKEYGGPVKGERQYSPPSIVKCKKHVVFGSPDERAISTSHVERQNLTMRMKMRRMTRLTRLLQEDREPRERRRAPLHALQLLSSASDAANHSGYGCGNRGPRVDHRRSDWSTRPQGTR